MIPRTLPEWGFGILALVTGVSILFSGDSRIAPYLIWTPGVTLRGVLLVFGLSFVALGALQMFVLARCSFSGGRDAVCDRCPSKFTCGVRVWRPRLALLGSIMWMTIAVSLKSGDTFTLSAGFTSVISIGEFLIFALLSRHIPWISSLR